MKNYRSYLFLAAVIILAGYYRFYNLGVTDFWVDEYYHVFAAKNLLSGLKPLLPSGLPYYRAFPYTITLVPFFKFLGVSEFSARIPSVILGILLIPAAYLIVRKLAGEKAALITAVFLAFDPFGYWWSRISRMYTFFELSFFVTALLLFYLITTKESFGKKETGYWIVFGGLLALTLSLQHIGVLVLTGASVYLIITRLLKYEDTGIYVTVPVVLLGILFLAVVLAGKGIRFTPYYIDVFLRLSPPFLVLIVASAAYAFWKKDKLGIYCAVAFFLPLAIYSLFFSSLTDSRYIMHVMPFTYLLMALPLSDFANKLFHQKKEYLKNVTLLAVFVVFVLYGKLAVAHSYNMGISAFPRYSRAAKAIKENSRFNENDTVISSLPVATTYYLGKTDYWLRTKNTKLYIFKEGGLTKDIYTGSSLINNTAVLKNIISKEKNVWIFTEERLYMFINRQTRDYVKNLELVYEDKPSKIAVYYASSDS